MTKAELLERLHALESRSSAPGAGQPVPGNARGELAEAALKDSEERIRAILQTAVEGIITIDEHGFIESINPAAERLFGYNASEVMGQNVSILMPSPYREQHDRYLAHYLQTGQARIIGIGREVVGLRKNGVRFPMDLSVSEVRLADRRLFTGFVRDLTERRRLEQEILQIGDMEQRRIGQDLHDGLCQQLAAVELMSEVLEQKLEKRSRADAARAAEIARQVREAIRQTRLLARGLSPVVLESEGLMSALEELASNTEKLFHVACRFGCDTPVLIHNHTVATHLYRIAQEAVSNAVKHGKAKQIEIELSSLGDQLRLAVLDDGLGFPKVPARDRGMGMHIMRYRAGIVGGSLLVQPGPGGGTSVACTLPRQLVPKGPRAS